MTNQDPKNTVPPVTIQANAPVHTPTPATPVPTPTPRAVAAPPTVAEQIWSEIRGKEIFMFALPGQKVADYCTPVPIDPTRCFLVAKATATLPALEEAIGPDYDCTSAEKYIIVSRKPKNAF